MGVESGEMDRGGLEVVGVIGWCDRGVFGYLCILLPS